MLKMILKIKTLIKIMKYENYYYLDANIKVEGNIRESCIPKPYRTLPYFTKDSLWLDYRDDDGLLDEAYAIFDIYYTLDNLKEYMNQSKNGKVFIKQKGKCVGSFQECVGYAAANADPHHRKITEYTMRLKRHQKNRETWFFIDGETDFLHSKREINNWAELTEQKITQKFKEIGILKFSIWFYVRDDRIDHIFRDKEIIAIYNKLIQNPDFIGS